MYKVYTNSLFAQINYTVLFLIKTRVEKFQ